MLRHAAVLVALAVVAVGPARAADDSGFFLKDGDRVVFYGDSITQQRLYTRFVQQYVYCRYPERDIRFFNAGWGGDTAKGANRRLLRDVLDLRPTVVTLLFGMNDGRYWLINDETLQSYTAEMKRLAESLTANGARVVVITPGCVDYDKNPGLEPGKYNETLAALAKAARKVGKAAGCRVIELHRPMLQFQSAQKKANSEFTMIPDGVHPDASGHVVMAHTILKGLGAEPMPVLGTVNVKSGKGQGLRVVESDAGRYVIETDAPTATGIWLPTEAQRVARECAFLDGFAGQRLTVKGLAPGTYALSVRGRDLADVKHSDLARGWMVSALWSARAKSLHDLVERKENHYYSTWREVRIPLEKSPGIEKTVAGLMEADAGYHEMLRAACKPEKPLRLTLERAPAGVNLARGRPYESSDPNKYDFGSGGLVDGSWVADREHCFSTGDDRRFPKTVTVDLGKSHKIGAIRFGAPPFGATRVVLASVSKNRKQWSEVGRVEFALKQAERRTFWLEDVSARFVRLTYKKQHEQDVGFSANFAFTTELEVFSAR